MVANTARYGAQNIRVMIDEINIYEQRVIAIDALGQSFTIPLQMRYGKGLWPKVGEHWVITRDTGPWVLAICLDAHEQPVITGPKAGESALTLQLLDAMAAAGLVEDRTDAEPEGSDDIEPEAPIA